jgi:hypothetical protein
MARDFAKQRKTSSRPPARKATRKSSGSARGNTTNDRQGSGGWRWYGFGVLTGFFLSFLLYLGSLPPVGEIASNPQQAASAPAEPPRARFDFYTLLPNQSITDEVVVEPAEVAQPRTGEAAEMYLLQAGSFRQRDDADRRRAELLLLGLDPKVEETTGDNGRWFRVYIGPFSSQSSMAKARSLTAAQDIDTLLLKRNQP